ncbi:MAG: DeoR/GlpR transcriptional regulator [Clostridia bacterium]|nr:DeoR/GlpR transcriptional regulator [Clostridia bacterium]
MISLTATERRNKIIEILNENSRVNVNELSLRFGVSSVAIRADLSELERQGMLTRVHGGAITSYKSYYDMSLVQRSNTNAREKKQIAAKINEIIKDSDTIIMNAGTTPIFVMREIADKRVTIVTNSIALALEGAKNPDFKIILLGGDVDTDYQFTYGVSALKALEQYTADILILSVDGIDAVRGISTFYHQEAEICRHMIKHAQRTIVAADYSKIGRSAFAKIDDINTVDVIVTSSNADNSCLAKLRNKNIEVIVAEQ